MNFWDLCVAFGRGIARLAEALWRLLAHMIRLTYRYWWLVLTILALGIAAAVYHTRPANIHFRVNAVALVNGASLQQFEQAFAPLRTGCLLPPDAKIATYLYGRQAQRFELFRVVDALADETPDYIDFKRKSSPKDTMEVQMQDRMCIQFRMPAYAIPLIPKIEEAVLEVLNGNEALQQSYAVYVDNLLNEVAFNHRQAVKLDSLTSAYYYNAGSPVELTDKNRTGVNFYGDRKIRLFLDEIYKQQRHTQLGDYRLQLATAPVVLENHFAIDPCPILTRTNCVVMYGLIAWILGCALAELIDKRKAFNAWLKA